MVFNFEIRQFSKILARDTTASWPRYIHTVAPATSFNAIDERTRLNFANPTLLSLNAPYSTSAESPSAARQKFKHSGVFEAGFGSLKLVMYLEKHGDAA